MSSKDLWTSLSTHSFFNPSTGLFIDYSKVLPSPENLLSLESKMGKAFSDMGELEKGAIANPDEKRMVGHYWLRAPELAPSKEISQAIIDARERVKSFVAKVHSAQIRTPKGEDFKYLLVIGIGGSALGPEFVTHALKSSKDKIGVFFFDNTDPDGMRRVLSEIPDLSRTLVVVISKSGGTKETRNGQLIAKAAFEASGLKFSGHFVAITGEGSELDKAAESEGWLARFPMWDWIGGRTSETSAVGLLPAALQGLDIDEVLRGAKETDVLTRRSTITENPAAILAAAWYLIGNGRGDRAMVLLPYSDRLELFSRYLQQLVMESLGKEKDLDGNVVHQGIPVYGNKGSTDQHAYVQQLRDGPDNFFVTFIEVLRDTNNSSKFRCSYNPATLMVESDVSSGDFLAAFLQGTRQALYEKGKSSLTIGIEEVNEYTIGALIALYERAVGLYASLININAYHQPGVEAGKKAAGEVIDIQRKAFEYLAKTGKSLTVSEISSGIDMAGSEESLFYVMRKLAANGRVRAAKGSTIFENKYSL